MNLFFRTLLVLVFIGVAIFAFARQFGSEKWKESEEEGGKSWPPSKATLWTGVKWIGVPGLIVALFFLFGQYTLEHDAYEQAQFEKKKKAVKEEAISSLYEAPSGTKLSDIPVKYDIDDDGEKERDWFTEIDESGGFWQLTPVLGRENSYYFKENGNEPVYEAFPSDNALQVYSGDILKFTVKKPRRTKHCAREPLVKWGVDSGAGGIAERRIFKLGTHRVKLIGQGHPVLDVFCFTDKKEIFSISAEVVEVEKI